MPDSLVLDATCAVLLVVPGPAQPRCEERIGGWKRTGHDLYAPGLWIYEVTSALCKAVRFGGLTAAEAGRCLTQALNLGVRPVAADEEQVRAAQDLADLQGDVADRHHDLSFHLFLTPPRAPLNSDRFHQVQHTLCLWQGDALVKDKVL